MCDMLENIPHLFFKEDNEALLLSIRGMECLSLFNPDKPIGLNGFSTHIYQQC